MKTLQCAVLLVMALVALASSGCAATPRRGDYIKQFDTPTSHIEHVEQMQGDGRINVHDIGWSDIPGGGMGFGVAPTGPGVMTARERALRTMPVQPAPMTCDMYREGDRQYGECRPATDDTVTIEMKPQQAPMR